MYRLYPLLIVVMGLVWSGTLHGQEGKPHRGMNRPLTLEQGGTGFCGSDLARPAMEPLAMAREMEMNRLLRELFEGREMNDLSLPGSGADAIYTIPVVVHIVHDGGSENISDAQVEAGIRHMNDAFANVGFYDSSTGVSVGIQFCLAKQDPDGAFTTGITRTRSSLTDLSLESQDIALKNSRRWDPLRYLNIWLVREITSASSGSGVAGYAYFPGSHGNPEDGIVGEARWFGSSADNSKVFVHEAGHYLGLYHTFEGGCANGNCLTDGDRVCDTPPDASTTPVSCGAPINTCTTDDDDLSANNPFRPIASGGAGDQNDLYTDYMDYGRLECYTVFTQGQKERMRAALTMMRASLLESKGCMSPCTSSVIASFTASALVVNVGTVVTFTNGSSGATSYEWRINGTPIATTRDASQTFNTQGRYVVVLSAFNDDPSCTDEDTITIEVRCPVRASFTASSSEAMPGDLVRFTNTTVTPATSYEWLIDGVPVSTSRDFDHRFAAVGGYRVMLVVSNGICRDTSLAVYIRVGTCKSGNEWNIWYFGNRAGLDFNSGRPVVLSDGQTIAREGVATICDEHGNLLFYTDGTTIWNRSHAVMQGGTGLGGSNLSAQSAVIVPMPMSRTLYYLFTTPNWTDGTVQLSYSVIDISLDGGLGAVTSTKNVVVNNKVAERVVAVPHGNCRDIWIVSHEHENDRYVAYLLTPTGLNTTPVVSAVGSVSTGANRYGGLKFSQDGTKLSSTLGGHALLPTVELLDFNRHTGVVSNPIVLADNDELRDAYSSEFSPDGRLLYTSTYYIDTLYQFDLTAGSAAAIRASKQAVGAGDRVGGRSLWVFQLGPDGRIYTSGLVRGSLGVIEYPNRRGVACQYVDPAIMLYGNGNLGLPNFMAGYGARGVRIDGPSAGCISDSLRIFSITSTECSRGEHSWKVLGNAEIVSTTETTATVRLRDTGGVAVVVEKFDGCGAFSDTLHMTVTPAPRVGLGPDTTLCSGVAVMLDAGPGFDRYLWQDGSSGRTLTASVPGIYWVEVDVGAGCVARDTMEIFPGDGNIAVNLGPDTAMCDGGIMVLDAGAAGLRYRWQDGSTDRRFTAFRPGKYWVEVIGRCGRAVDTIVIRLVPSLIDLGRDTAVCGRIDILLDAGEGFSSYEWQDGSTGRTLRATAPGLYQVRARNGSCEVVESILIESIDGGTLTATLTDLPSAQVTPGAVITIPLRLSTTWGKEWSAGRSYRASIRFNGWLLMPTGGTPQGRTEGRERIISLSGTLGESDTVALLTFLVLVGDSGQATIMVDSFVVETDCPGDVVRENGTITIALCEAGGHRLIELLKMIGLKVTPGREITIDYHLAEEGTTRLSLLNALGERVRMVVDERRAAGDHTATFDGDELPSGLYFVLLETSSGILVEKLIVGR